MGSRVRVALQELRSWAVPILGAVPAVLLIVFLLSQTDPGLRQLILIVFPVLPWFLIMLYDGWSLFAIGLWVIPAVLAMVVATGMAPGVPRVALGVAVAVFGGALCMHEGTWRRYGGFVRSIANWLVERTLPAPTRLALRLTNRQPRRGEPELALAYRALAREVREFPAPNDWRHALSSVAAVHDLAADMLEGSAPWDKEALSSAAKERDRLVIELLRAQSLTYRLVNCSPFRQRRPEPSA